MHRFWDILPRAIRFKWKSTVPTTLNKLHRASDQQLDENDQSLFTPASPRVCHQLEAPKINCLTPCLPKLITPDPKSNWGHNPNQSCFLSRTFSVIGWGTVLAISLQFNKQKWKLWNNSNNSESSWIQYITYALPLDRLTILDFDQKPPQNAFSECKPEEFPQKKQEPSDTLDDKFGKVFEKITALDKNIQGITAANGGDYEGAVEHWKKSSVLGYSKSNFNLGLCYEKGKGVTKDLTKAKKYYQVAADQDHTQALYNLALLQLDSKNFTKNSFSHTTMNLLERAAKLGLSDAQTYLGLIYAECDDDKAVEMFKAAAEQQDAAGFYYLALCFEDGRGVDLNESKAAELFSKAANNGHSQAQYCLANYYEHGLGGLPKDKKFALELYRKSAKAGNEDSQNRLREISQEDSNKPDVISSTMNLDSVEKVSQIATLFSDSFSSIFNASVMALKGSFTNNNNHLPEEQFNSHPQYMPHCCAKRDIPLPMTSNTNEVLCS